MVNIRHCSRSVTYDMQSVSRAAAKPALAQPNQMRKRNVQALYLSKGFSDFKRGEEVEWRRKEKKIKLEKKD
ncbi:MAG: hypothetical protein C4B59_14330 [Candidatus Methanogaster sp.]|uniref:Uncharacterized protein n=1 Tax=Candidatus Methanogaster sp. TaxID=3386292 RepID=A0AC61KZE6_9EURY|nr:MAG: hypothetical protein C4B59_14330 [ANME-2 cluster archaeon]